MSEDGIVLELPWPPSVNHYYKHVGPRVLISREGRRYRDRIASLIQASGVKKFTDCVSLVLELYPPDFRRRDIDNVEKSLFDALTFGGLYEDDSLIKRLYAEMLEPMPPEGLCVVGIAPYRKGERRHAC